MVTFLGSNSEVLDTSIYAGFSTDPGNITGLTFALEAGKLTTGSGSTVVAAGTVSLTDDTTNYVYIDSGSVAVGDDTIPASATHLLYEVVTASGVITGITDLRASSL